jgi:hypothetical protein
MTNSSVLVFEVYYNWAPAGTLMVLVLKAIFSATRFIVVFFMLVAFWDTVFPWGFVCTENAGNVSTAIIVRAEARHCAIDVS